MIPLKVEPIRLMMLIVIGLLILLFFLMPYPGERGENNLKYSTRMFFNQERGMDFPPVFLPDESGNIHYLGLDLGREGGLSYFQLKEDFSPEGEKKRELGSQIQVEYLFPVGVLHKKPVFGMVSREEGANKVYRVTVEENDLDLRPLDISISRHHDVAAVIHEGEIFKVYVQREGGKYQLWMQQPGKENSFLVDKCEEFLGLPRLIIDDNNRVHLQWKGSRDNRGISLYQTWNLEKGEPIQEEPVDLGFASYYFGSHDGRPIYYREDPGADLLVDLQGRLFIAWTDSLWEPEMGRHSSHIYLVCISEQGQIEDRWQIQGFNFPLFPSLFLDEKGGVGLIWEDFFGTQFNLVQAVGDNDGNYFSNPERITKVYGNNRLPRVVNVPGGGFILMAREVQGSSDKIWGISSADLGSPSWYHNWQLWFVGEGLLSIVLEGIFIILYSLVMTLFSLAQSVLGLVVIGVALYLMQKIRMLDRLNCFLFFGLMLIALTLFREFLPLFYSPPAADHGYMLFSGLMATALVLWVSRKNWFRGGEEFLYLYYALLWMFSDIFILNLILAPAAFMP